MSTIFINNKLIRVSYWLLKFPNIEQFIQELYGKNHGFSLNQDGFLRITHNQKETTLKPLIRSYLEELASREEEIILLYESENKKGVTQQYTGSLQKLAQNRCHAFNKNRLKNNIKRIYEYLNSAK